MAERTGKVRFRRNWRGKLILQIEEKHHCVDYDHGFVESWDYLRWRDAKISDVTGGVMK